MEEVSGKSEPDANNEAGGEDNGERRKFRRLPRACNACRKRKVRCDGGDPCSRCKEQGLDCVYSHASRRIGPRKSPSPSPPALASRYSPPRADSSSFMSGGHVTPPPIAVQFDIADFGGLRQNTDSFSHFLDYSTLVPPQNEYTYVAISSEEVRLLLLSKGKSGDALHCSLKTMAVDKLKGSQLVYQALSYAWGEDIPGHEIFVQDIHVPTDGRTPEEFYRLAQTQARPRRFYVRSNLHNALKRLRSETVDLWFWIDAISINQNDSLEKSHQLAKMLDIYCNAWNVCIWVGESPEGDTDLHPLDFVSSIVNLKLLDRMISGATPDERLAKAWVDFANLLRRPWFQRRWVIQEVASSRSASVQCGDKSINWIDFSDAVQLFLAKIDRIRITYDSSQYSKKDPDALNYIEFVGAGAIVTTTNNLLRKTQSGAVLDRLWNIESLVLNFLHFEASDARDTVYALLPLANDGHLSTPGKGVLRSPSLLIPDYTKPVLQVYANFVKHCIVSTGSLDIICRHWALSVTRRTTSQQPFHFEFGTDWTSNKSLLPTWIGLIADSPFGPPSLFTGRLNGDSLVGEPGHRIYNASRGRSPEVDFDNIFEDDFLDFMHPAPPPKTLRVKGAILGSISRVSARVVDGTISEDSLAMAGWNKTEDINNMSDRVWRTLVADRDSRGKSTPFWYRRACMYSLHMTSPEGDLNTSKLISNKSLPETVIEYLKRVQAVVWSRKFFVCHDSADKSKRLFGLGSRHLRGGEVVCILYGCSVPVVLRKSTTYSEHAYYEFLGECYIHGVMDGEFLATMTEESIAKATVEFRII